MGEVNGQAKEVRIEQADADAGGSHPQTSARSATNEAVSAFTGRLIVKKHTFEGHDIRSATRDGDPWFVAADVCRALNLQAHKGSYGHHLFKLDEDEKIQIADATVSRGSATPTCFMGVPEGAADPGQVGVRDCHTGGPVLEPGPDAWLVSEAGLSILTMRSRAATTPGTAAHRFRRWVTHEVLPAIRKTGHYGGPRITYGSFEPDNTPPGRYVSRVGRDGKWHHYHSPYAAVRNDMDADDARTLVHGIKVIQSFWHKLQPVHGDQPELLQSYTWHALGRAVRSAAEDADQLIAMHESRRLRQPNH